MYKKAINKLGDANLGQILDRHRALLLLIVLFIVSSLFAPNFFNAYNFTAILKGASLNAIVAIGFTLIFILGQLDLSIGSVVMLCGMLVIGLQPSLSWAGAFIASVLAGAIVGLINGLIVTKLKIHSFITTLGMMTILTGVLYLYSDGGSKAVDDFTMADWLEMPVIPLLPPRVIITILLVLVCTFILTKTRWGRGFFVVGGNPETAWLAGLNKDWYIISGFIISSTMSAIGGALFAMSLASMTSYAILANKTLMTVLAAVIIGGTSMAGGKGSIVKSFFAVLLLTTLFNTIGCLGYGFEVQIFANGLILAVVVLLEAYANYKHDLLRGQRPELLKELKDGSLPIKE